MQSLNLYALISSMGTYVTLYLPECQSFPQVNLPVHILHFVLLIG
jgi:hypothetical protein